MSNLLETNFIPPQVVEAGAVGRTGFLFFITLLQKATLPAWFTMLVDWRDEVKLVSSGKFTFEERMEVGSIFHCPFLERS